MNIELLTPNITKEHPDLRNTILDFGTIKKNSSAIVEVIVDTQGIKDFKTQSTCGCSTSEEEKIGTKTKVKIEYKNTHNTGTVAKTIKFLSGKEVVQLVKIKLKIV